MAVRQTADEAFNERYDGGVAPKRENSDTNRRLNGRSRSSRDVTRNARTETRRSSMPGAPKNEEFVSSKRDIATDFNASYAKRGIQPSYLANDNEPQKQPYRQPEQITRSEQRAQETQAAANAAAKRPRKTYKRRKALRKKLGAGAVIAKVRVTSVNAWVWGWGIWAWLLFQVPFALASLFFFALTEYVHQLYVDLSTTTNDEGLIEIVVEGALAGLVTVAERVLQLIESWTGIDVGFIAPANFASLTYLVVLAIGWFGLLLIYFQYKMALLNPLGGERGGTKLGLFLLAMIGYAVPIANLFPWFIFWTMAVWKSPK